MDCSGWSTFASIVVALLVLGRVTAEQNVTQVLVKNGLPRGLLPATVESYTLAENGKFEVNLWSTCTIKVESHEVYYKKKITGELSYGTISNLGGIQVHQFFWLSVSSIEVDQKVPDSIWFRVGVFQLSLSTDLFEEAPLCLSMEEEEQGHMDSMSFSDWLQMALDGNLKVNLPSSLDFGASARKLLQ